MTVMFEWLANKVPLISQLSPTVLSYRPRRHSSRSNESKPIVIGWRETCLSWKNRIWSAYATGYTTMGQWPSYISTFNKNFLCSLSSLWISVVTINYFAGQGSPLGKNLSSWKPSIYNFLYFCPAIIFAPPLSVSSQQVLVLSAQFEEMPSCVNVGLFLWQNLLMKPLSNNFKPVSLHAFVCVSLFLFPGVSLLIVFREEKSTGNKTSLLFTWYLSCKLIVYKFAMLFLSAKLHLIPVMISCLTRQSMAYHHYQDSSVR